MTEKNGVERSTATEVLRRMLDERGAWWDYGIAGPTTTRFTANGVDLTFTPMRGGLVCSTILTPEQAIAATLGATDAKPTQAESSDTCEYCNGKSFDGQTVMISNHGWQHINYCPNCGRRIEQ